MKTVLNVKIDPRLKKESQKMAKRAGIPLSLVVNDALRDFIATGSVTISVPLKPSQWLKKVLRETEKDWKNGRKNYDGPFYSVDEFIKGLKS